VPRGRREDAGRRCRMASVFRLDPGGGSTIEKTGLPLEEAKELAARMTEAGQRPGCAWCVGTDDEDEKTDD